jgi:T4 superinfection immunity protein
MTTLSSWYAIGACISTGTNLTTKKETKLILLELIKPVLHALPTPMPSATPMVSDAAAAGWGIGMILFCLFMYFLPALVGMRHRNAAAIFVLNFFLGWTVIGWVISLVWACTNSERAR